MIVKVYVTYNIAEKGELVCMTITTDIANDIARSLSLAHHLPTYSVYKGKKFVAAHRGGAFTENIKED